MDRWWERSFEGQREGSRDVLIGRGQMVVLGKLEVEQQEAGPFLGLVVSFLLFNYWITSHSFDPMNYSPPGSSVHGILKARILEWVAVSFSTMPGERCIFHFLLLSWSWQWGQILEVPITYQVEAVFETIVTGVLVGLSELIYYSWWSDFLQVWFVVSSLASWVVGWRYELVSCTGCWEDLGSKFHVYIYGLVVFHVYIQSSFVDRRRESKVGRDDGGQTLTQISFWTLHVKDRLIAEPTAPRSTHLWITSTSPRLEPSEERNSFPISRSNKSQGFWGGT